MASQMGTRRSTRIKAAPTPFDQAPNHHPSNEQVVPEANLQNMKTAGNAKDNARERKRSPSESVTEISQPIALSTRPHHEFWFLCPVEDCDKGYSVPSNVGKHYREGHADKHTQRAWTSNLAVKVDFIDWLNNRTKGKASKARQNQFSHLVRNGEDQVTQHAHSPSPAAAAAGSIHDRATSAIGGDDFDEPASKRHRFEDVLDRHRAELQDFLEQGLAEAEERAAKAVAKLGRLTYEREVEMARDNARMNKMEWTMRDQAKEIQEARKEAITHRLLNPLRPKHGGFVY